MAENSPNSEANLLLELSEKLSKNIEALNISNDENARIRPLFESQKKQIDELNKTIDDLNGTVTELNETIDSLNKKIDELQATQAKQTETIDKLTKEKEELKAKLQAALQAPYSKKSEKAPKEESSTQPKEKKTKERKKENNTLLTVPPDYPVVDEYKAPQQTICDACGHELIKIGEQVYYRIAVRNYRILVRVHVPIMECPNCDNPVEKEESSDMLAGTVCDPTFLAFIIVNKMGFGLPLYRQEFDTGTGVVTRQLLSSWIMKTGKIIDRNLIPLLEKELFAYELINMDETYHLTLKLKNKDGTPKAPNSKYNSFIICRGATGSDGSKGPIVFSFHDNKRNETIISLLNGYDGVVQTDGLEQYASVNKKLSFVHVECLVHSARYAKKAAKGLTEGAAVDIVTMYQDIFEAENKLRKRFDAGLITEEEFLDLRQKEVAPLFVKLKKFCENIKNDEKKPPAEALRKAVNYFLERYDALVRYMDYSYVTPTNNECERNIRKICIGRNNWLFSFTPSGARVLAAYYSLVYTCKNMGIDPELYLLHLFLNAGNIKDDDTKAWIALLPGNCDLSDAEEYNKMFAKAEVDTTRTEPYVLRGTRK